MALEIQGYRWNVCPPVFDAGRWHGIWRRDYGWIEHTLRFIGGEEALVLSQRLKSYQQEREEKPKKREKRKYQQEER